MLAEVLEAGSLELRNNAGMLRGPRLLALVDLARFPFISLLRSMLFQSLRFSLHQ